MENIKQAYKYYLLFTLSLASSLPAEGEVHPAINGCLTHTAIVIQVVQMHQSWLAMCLKKKD
mgnify:CR=1 FL=1